MAWDGARRASTLAVEEDEENKRANQGETSNDADNNSCNRSTAQTGALIASGGNRAPIRARGGTRARNGDGLDFAVGGGCVGDTGVSRRGGTASLWSKVSGNLVVGD